MLRITNNLVPEINIPIRDRNRFMQTVATVRQIPTIFSINRALRWINTQLIILRLLSPSPKAISPLEEENGKIKQRKSCSRYCWMLCAIGRYSRLVKDTPEGKNANVLSLQTLKLILKGHFKTILRYL